MRSSKFGSVTRVHGAPRRRGNRPAVLSESLARRHLVANVLLTGITLSLNFAFNTGTVMATGWLDAWLRCALEGAPIALDEDPSSVVALDASTYVCRLMHALPPLWKVHSVHHILWST
jgi:sterol desaturase/sphingolipid hydroxylase (fatty acid hydroxylase superfamily)